MSFAYLDAPISEGMRAQPYNEDNNLEERNGFGFFAAIIGFIRAMRLRKMNVKVPKGCGCFLMNRETGKFWFDTETRVLWGCVPCGSHGRACSNDGTCFTYRT